MCAAHAQLTGCTVDHPMWYFAVHAYTSADELEPTPPRRGMVDVPDDAQANLGARVANPEVATAELKAKRATPRRELATVQSTQQNCPNPPRRLAETPHLVHFQRPPQHCPLPRRQPLLQRRREAGLTFQMQEAFSENGCLRLVPAAFA